VDYEVKEAKEGEKFFQIFHREDNLLTAVFPITFPGNLQRIDISLLRNLHRL
jgi:hypothetical protein